LHVEDFHVGFVKVLFAELKDKGEDSVLSEAERDFIVEVFICPTLRVVDLGVRDDPSLRRAITGLKATRVTHISIVLDASLVGNRFATTASDCIKNILKIDSLVPLVNGRFVYCRAD
jgi:hypothetical protein